MIGLYWGNCKSKIFFHQYQYFFLIKESHLSLNALKLSSKICWLPIFHLYHTNTEFAHWDAILKKLNKIWIQKIIQTNTIKIQGKNLSLSLLSNLSQNIARVIIVREINTVPYQSIDDHIIHQIAHHINVVKETESRILSFLNIAYGKAIIKNANIITHMNPISV